MKYVFGPVKSKRLGRSLGIDLIPHKICNYDCIYCECGKTSSKINAEGRFVKPGLLIKELKNYFHHQTEEEIDFITITGSGEPTLHAGLEQLIDSIRCVSSVPIAILTNGSRMGNPLVMQALSKADVLIPSLDAISQEVFERMNHPHQDLKIEEIICNMIKYRKKFLYQDFWLEILMVSGVNDDKDHLIQYLKVINTLMPSRIHLCTVTRPPAYSYVIPTPLERMNWFKNYLGDRAEIIMEEIEPRIQNPIVLECRILETLSRRPSRIDDFADTREDLEIIRNLMAHLEAEGLINKKIYQGEVYYVLSKTK